jgi:hypothetical protein
LGGDNARFFQGEIIERKLFHQMILAEEFEKRQVELERQLIQRQLTQTQEERIRSLTEKICKGLDNLDFGGKKELLRLLVEKVMYDGQNVEIQTIIPIGQQLHPLHQEGLRGMGF